MSRRFPVFLVLALALVYLFSGQSIVGPLTSRAQAKAGAEPDQQGTQTPTPLPCVDQYEPDDTPVEAKAMPCPGGQRHSICPAGDVDYVRFVAYQGSYYDIGVWVPQADVTMRVQLYAPDGITELASGEGRTPAISWCHCTSDGPYFVKVSVVDPFPGAPGHTYNLRVISVGHDTPTLPPPTLMPPPRYVPLALNRWPLDALSPAAAAAQATSPTATITLTPTPAPSATSTPSPSPTPQCTADPPTHLDLSAEPSVAEVGDLITLRVAYHNIGMPYLYFGALPEGLVTPDPPLGTVCKYSEHPNGCTAITFRALAPGGVTFDASATGEVAYCDNGRLALGHGGGRARAPVTLVIERPPARFIPFVGRYAR